MTGEILGERNHVVIFPATHFLTSGERLEGSIKSIEAELAQRLEVLRADGKLLEAQRLEQRTTYDIEMLREMGYCSGIENYSRHMDGRKPGEAPYTLLDFFPDDFLIVVDESHVTMPQVRGMYNGDSSRKQMLVDYGFRLPSALDNRPLKLAEFEERVDQIIYMSATPGVYEQERTDTVVQQIIRPTGLLDPEVEVRPIMGQMDDLVAEIDKRTKRDERVFVTTLTKKMAEDLTDYFKEMSIKVKYLHSDIKTLERTQIVRDLRLGKFDVLVGINLLRAAMDETARRRAIQMQYNAEHGIVPKTVKKAIRDVITMTTKPKESTKALNDKLDFDELSKPEQREMIARLEEQMKTAAKNLDFEDAAALRDTVMELKAQLD